MQRIHKNKSDFGMPDYFEYYQKTLEGSCDSKKYNQIVSDFNKNLVQLIIEDNLIFYMPGLGFEICIRKEKRKPKLVDGKVVNTVPVDWKATNELWDKDEEAREKKLLVRYNNSHTAGFVFRIYCRKFKARVKHKNLFKFKPNRKFQRALAARVFDLDKDPYDAFLLYNKDV